MDRKHLDGSWKLQFGPQVNRASQSDTIQIPESFNGIAATVPGNVELDMIEAGLLPADLDHSHNVYKLRELETHQWWYSRSFEVSENEWDDSTELVFEGIDTLASVWLNGVKIAQLENMLIAHRVPVGALLRTGPNELVIAIDSTVLAAHEYEVEPGTWAMENNWESLHIRKAAHSFGWDIMPRIISAGIWRSVYLETLPKTRFRSVCLATIETDPEKNFARMVARWDLKTERWPLDDCSVRLSVHTIDKTKKVFETQSPVLSPHGQIWCDLNDIELWWPLGFGKAALYHITVDLANQAGDVLANWSSHFGFRTIRLNKTDTTNADGDGEFAFIVNGEKIFIKGTNWVPLDAFHSRDADRLAETHQMLVELNCNMIRCWGGNVYEDTAFFELCDRAGIMVWQDFAFGCALYPQTPDFHEKVRLEAEAIIPKFRNHPSLALWAGNNEIDAFYEFAKPFCDPNVDDQVSREVLASACRRLDPVRDYLPSSPFYSSKLWEMGAPFDARPEDHLWGPRDDFKGKFYTSSNAHFASEIGYHGCPARSSLEKMMSPDSLWPWQENEEWLTHAVRPQPRGTAYNYRVQLMASQAKLLFGKVPEELDDFIFASQVSQAEALKFFIERFRMGKGRRSGILWWNLRDGWPEISDAIVDYYGAKKLAFRVVQQVQQDICIMLSEPQDGLHQVIAVNDTRHPVKIEFLITEADKPLLKGSHTLDANGMANLGTAPESTTATCYHISWQGDGLKGSNHYLAGPRPFDLDLIRASYEM
ncbi:hypothetical protein JIN87_13160 [Pelagicoccus mobilis]|uniref:beta-mannosidase n=2 Tax=Pelagicoccus mobilis TaxID=415221 RepID=A0A934VRD4_9BACT|nr:hypothetical protein [Pelagicoccus mobilis]